MAFSGGGDGSCADSNTQFLLMGGDSSKKPPQALRWRYNVEAKETDQLKKGQIKQKKTLEPYQEKGKV